MGYNNQFKTAVLLALLAGIMLAIGYLIGNGTAIGAVGGLSIALAFALLFNLGAYFWSDKLVLKMYRAKEIQEKDDPELYKLVKEVTHLAGVPMPRVYVVPTQSPNAFATGRNPKNASIAFTEGILQLLNKSELKGVTAHEISHIKNRDILVATIAATIAAVISYVSMVARWGAIFGGLGGRDNNNNILELLVLAILAPVLAVIIQLAISRSREYLADETGANMIHSPHGLADALIKIHDGVKHKPLMFGNTSTASLFIESPFRGRGFLSLFDTHPPMEERVKRLRKMR